MRNKTEILEELRSIESQLSPENLYMDGEADPVDANRRGKKLNQKRLELIAELGYEPSFEELWKGA
jgi:hypothetical protein